jgi:hypothetical protein
MPPINEPAEHLCFLADGTVEARTRGGQTSEMGRTTIQVCALMRADLLGERVARSIWLEVAIQGLLEGLKNGTPPNPVFRDALRASMAPEAPFAAFAKAYVEARLGPLYAKVTS